MCWMGGITSTHEEEAAVQDLFQVADDEFASGCCLMSSYGLNQIPPHFRIKRVTESVT